MNSGKCEYINPEILKWARVSAGYTTDALLASFKNIKKWESGEDYPIYKQLESLSNKYKLPIAVFFSPETPAEITKKKSFRTLPQNEIDNINPELVKIFKKAQFMQMNLAELNNYKNPASKNITEYFNLDCDTLYSNIEKVRTYLGISIEKQLKTKDTEELFKIYREAFAESGIFVFKDAFKNTNVCGFCLFDIEFPIIYVNNSQPKNRQIFTLFHELAHLLLGDNHIEFEDTSYLKELNDSNKNIEIKCNKYAGEYLVPYSELEKHIQYKNIDDNLIKQLATLFSVSQEVILRRFLDNKIISKAYYTEKVNLLNNNISKK